MPARFKPKRPDGRSEWQVVFDVVQHGVPEQVYTYAELGDLLETEDRQRVQQATRRANEELWQHSNKSLMNVRNLGYRVLRAQEHEKQATDYQSKGKRQMATAVSVISATDLNALTDPERIRTLHVANVLMMMAKAVDFHGRQLAHHDQLIQDLEQRIDRLEKN